MTERQTLISVYARAYRKEKIEIIEDVYSLENELDCAMQSIAAVAYCETLTKNECFSVDFDFTDDADVTICDYAVENIKINTEVHSGEIAALISADYSVFYKDAADNIAVITKEFTFESELASLKVEQNIEFCCVQVLSGTALHVNGGKIRLNLEMIIESRIANCCKIDCFTSVDDSEMKPENKNGYVICFCSKNEDLWNIAKENRTSVELIKKVNGITTDTLCEDRILLLPVF